MSLVPGVTILHQGTKTGIADFIDTDIRNMKLPDGNYFYALSVRARNGVIAKGKAMAAVREDGPARLTVTDTKIVSLEQVPDSSVGEYMMLAAVDHKF